MRSNTLKAALFASSVLVSCSLPSHSHAQETLSLPDRVITATRVPTLAEQIPAGVTIIDHQTIEERGYTTLVDALATVPGMRVVQSGGPGGNASVFIRGTNSNHVLVLRDGMPINDPSDPGGAFNFGVDTLDDVDRIEVVRGPMSSLYGSGAIGGVINLISRHGEGGPHATAELAGGFPAAILGAAGLSGSTGKFDYNLQAQSRSDKGFDTTPSRESVYTGARNGYRSSTGSLELGYTPIEGTRLSVYLRGRQAVFGLDNVGGFPSYDANNYSGHDDNFYGRIGATTKLFNGAWESSLFLAGLGSDRRYLEPLEAADPNQASGDTRYHARRADLQWNNTIHLPDFGPSASGAFTFGYEHIADSATARLNTSSDGFPYISSVRASDHSDAGHAGVQTTLWERLTLTGDVREEGARYGGDAFTYRFGGVLAVPEAWSRLKASYGTGFRAPSLYDLFGVDSYGYRGNPNLRPERSRGYEVGGAVDIPGFGRRNAATIEVTYFNNRIRDLIETVFAPIDTQINIARAKTRGVETSLTLRPAPWLDAVLSYTYTEARNQADNSLLLRRPRDQASVNVRARPLPGLTIAPELIYTSRFADYLVDDNGFASGVGLARSGTVFNLSVSYEVRQGVTLFADARNLGGSKFEPASGFQMPGRSVLAGTRLRF